MGLVHSTPGLLHAVTANTYINRHTFLVATTPDMVDVRRLGWTVRVLNALWELTTAAVTDIAYTNTAVIKSRDEDTETYNPFGYTMRGSVKPRLRVLGAQETS